MIQPTNQFYWLGGVMQLMCKNPNGPKELHYCHWSVNSKKLIEFSLESSIYASRHLSERSIYRPFGDLSKGECGIRVVALKYSNLIELVEIIVDVTQFDTRWQPHWKSLANGNAKWFP